MTSDPEQPARATWGGRILVEGRSIEMSGSQILRMIIVAEKID
jgi:hypothetical protein